MAKPWTCVEVRQMMDEIGKGLSYKQVGDILGRTEDAVAGQVFQTSKRMLYHWSAIKACVRLG